MKTCLILVVIATLALGAPLASGAPASADRNAEQEVQSVPYSYQSPDKSNPFNVAIFRDVLPWGYTEVDDILAAHGISYTVFSSADIGTANLSQYDKVFLASAQPAGFISTVQANLAYFDDYVSNGGYLVASLCHQAGAYTVGTYYPGTSMLTAFAYHDPEHIVDPDHAVFNDPNAVTDAELSGWNASAHGELYLSSGATLAINGENSTISLAERSQGYGYVLATTLTYEFIGANDAVQENIVLYRLLNPAIPARVALFYDVLPWYTDGVQQALTANGIPYTEFGSADMGAVDLSEFTKVMILNGQYGEFLDAVMAHRTWFEDYVAAGGNLVMGLAEPDPALPAAGSVFPGGVVFEEFVTSSTVTITLPESPLFNVPNTVVSGDLSGGYASHGHLRCPSGTELVRDNVAEPGPTLIELGWGSGSIVATTLTFPLFSNTFTENLVMYEPVAFPVITSVADVVNDQGGQVRLVWTASGWDVPGSTFPITGYEVYRRQDGAKKVGWDYVMTAPAHGDPAYQAVVPTLCDSTIADGLCETTFLVQAVTDAPFAWFASGPGTGYSVDNLAPSVPTSLLLASGQLGWDECPDADFDYFTVYGADAPDLSGATVIGHTTGTNFDARGLVWSYLLVTATDFAGNEGGAAVTGGATGVAETPTAFRLVDAAPNPFNPRTTIRYDLPRDARVSLRVYDLSGRLVRTLVNGEEIAAGSREAFWDGRSDAGRPAAAGTYFCRMEAREYRGVIRMTLVK